MKDKNTVYYSINIVDGKTVITMDYPKGMIRDEYDVERVTKAILADLTKHALIGQAW